MPAKLHTHATEDNGVTFTPPPPPPPPSILKEYAGRSADKVKSLSQRRLGARNEGDTFEDPGAGERERETETC